MPRLSVTVDEEIVQGLDRLPDRLSGIRPLLEEEGFTFLVYARPRMVQDVLESFRHIAIVDEPSDASIVREALKCYFHLVGEVQTMADLEAGYSELAADQERDEVLRAATRRAAAAWADEP
jgi:hypothetical protein